MLLRTKKTPGNFFQMHKQPIENADLSWKAKGILAYLMSKPPNWEIRMTDLVKHATEGRHAVRSGIKELEEQGYVVRYREHDEETGHFVWVHFVYETPAPESERSHPEDRKLTPSSENPSMDNPSMDNPSMDNLETNNNDSNNNDSSKNEFAPSARATPAEPAGTDDDSGFGVFERKYPKADDAATGKDNTRSARKFAQRAASEPWRAWGNGNVHRVGDVAADDIQRVCYVIEDITGLRPNGSITGWLVGAAGVYRAGRGDWATIERGIKEAWKREVQYRPSTLSASQKSVDRNGFVKAVAKAATERVQVDQPTNHLTFEEAMA